jgi:hypothetical protein
MQKFQLAKSISRDRPVTVWLPEDLHLKARHRALANHTTLKELMREGLELRLAFTGDFDEVKRYAADQKISLSEAMAKVMRAAFDRELKSELDELKARD